MEIFNKIKNKASFTFSVVLLLSTTIIPSVKLPFEGSISYLSFSDYSLVLGFLLIALVYLFAIAEKKWHIQTIKVAVGLIWIFFTFETISSLINYREFFGSYNILNTLQLGAYIGFVLLIIITFKSLKLKSIENKINS